MYEEKYCLNCVHVEDCPILVLHSLWNYEQHKDETKMAALELFIPRVMHSMSDGIEQKINDKCRMFVRRDGST